MERNAGGLWGRGSLSLLSLKTLLLLAAEAPSFPTALPLQAGLAESDPPVAKAPADRAAGQRPKLCAGGLPLLDLRGLCALFPCAQGILEGPLTEDESLWLKHPYHVSVAHSCPLPRYPVGLLAPVSRAALWQEDPKPEQPLNGIFGPSFVRKI